MKLTQTSGKAHSLAGFPDTNVILLERARLMRNGILAYVQGAARKLKLMDGKLVYTAGSFLSFCGSDPSLSQTEQC